MSIFSLSWFKRQSELENLVIEEQQLKNEILKKELGVDLDKKPYLNVKLVNDSLTIVLNDGSVLSKPNATKDDYYAAVNARTEGSLYSICADSTVMEEKRKQEAEIARIKAVQQGIKRLEGLADFEIEGNSVKLAGTGRTMPQLLVEKFIELVDLYDVDPYNDVTDDQEYQALKRFFMWCCLNPRAEVANDLYDFLNKNSFRITKQGFFVALRNVVTLRGSVELVQFVSNAYNKVKAVWKKSPDKYTVFLENCEYKLVHEDDLYETELVECQDCDGQGIDWSCENDEDSVCEFCDGVGQCDNMNQINHGEKIGNLTELYLDLPNRHECNWSTADCAHAGLHFTADEINYVGCGDQSVLILINPMKVVGIGEAKGRCYEYLPIMTVSREESTEILHDLDFDTLELDEAFAIHELENLAEKVKGGFVLEASKHQFNIPAMTHVQIENIVASLEEMKYSISNRVNIIK
jgi:hypothetical protein